MFYHAQYARHENFVLRGFQADHNMPADSSPSEWGLDDIWQEEYINSGLQEHYEDFQFFSERITQNRENLQHRISHQNPAERLNLALSRQIPTKVINELWFNTTINNPESIVSDLCQLPYKIYLKSLHWARIKAAMLLIHRAVCQEEWHSIAGESWYFGDWESDIHVHHLNYTHRGNERYNDLVLLCSKHHSLWHTNMDKIGNPGFNILDDEIS